MKAHANRWMLLLTALVGCGSPAAVVDGGTDAHVGRGDATPADAALDAGAIEETFEILGERMATVLDVPRRIELIRATRSDGARTYLLYVHAQVEPAPLVILNQPYAGIDWTEEDVDARWAALGPGIQADVDAPSYDGDDVTVYGPQTIQAAADEGAVYLLNGAAVLHVYARFYAGGTLLDDAIDASMAYAFAASRPDELMLDRIGSYGGSWGGMMALFGAALAEDAHPIAISALAPPSDFVDLYAHTHTELPAVFPTPATVESFFSPYWRRAEPAIGLPPSASDPRAMTFMTAALCASLPPNVLITHDDWDLLIPIRQTEALAASCPGQIEPLYWRRGAIPYATTPLDHGPFNAEPVYPTVLTFTSLHILHAILGDAAMRLTLGHGAAFEAYLTLVRDAREDGEDVTWALEPLRGVADARVQLFDPSTMAFTPGADVLAPAFNAVFGTTYDAAELRAQLEIGLP